MTTFATQRALTAIVVATFGLLIAVLGGRPEGAVFAAPWVVLVVLATAGRRRAQPAVRLVTSAQRVIDGDDVGIATTVHGVRGTVRVTHLLGDSFVGAAPIADLDDATHVERTAVAGRSELSATVRASTWGRHHVGRAEVEILEPFGLFRTHIGVDEPATVVVHPAPHALQGFVRPRLVRRVVGSHGSGEKGRGVEFAEVRPYAAGDSIRDVNWRATARSNELWVSQRHPDRATDVVLMVDTFVESGHDARAVVGRAIEAATALAESHLAASDRVGLVDFGGVVRWVTPGAGRLQLQRLTDALLATGLFANAAGRDLTVVTPRVLPPRSLVVALTPLLDDRFVDALFALAARGTDIAVIECEPRSTLREQNETQRLAGRIWRLERQMVRDRLVDRGVAVRLWRPGAPLTPVIDDLRRVRRSMIRSAR